MLFNSIDFAIFLPIVFFLYWFVTNSKLKLQNLLVLVSSLIFYGWWDWRFLFLLLFSSLVDYSIGYVLGFEQRSRIRKILLCVSICVNLGFLGFFKYYNFFLDNFIHAFSFFGHPISVRGLSIVLPVGISFYTFQTLSYTIDVYRKKLEPTSDVISFFAFVSFFPQLVAGPIERATHLLPQFYRKRTFNYSEAVDGCKQILWGLFKKMVIADNCAEYANLIFNNSTEYSGVTLFFGALFFTFQIYGDFSGYSDIAIGTARLFGFDLMQNFAFPYFSRDIAEFWRRWHISLSTWFRDYVYIPLGGSRGSQLLKVRNVFAIFLLSGFWHGANWTFVFWGALNAIYFLPLLLFDKNRSNIGDVASGKFLPSFSEFFMILSTFLLTVFAWIFFRAENLGHAFDYIFNMVYGKWIEVPRIPMRGYLTILIVIAFMIIEWLGREGKFGIQSLKIYKYKGFSWAFYLIIIYTIIKYMNSGGSGFIYFQF